MRIAGHDACAPSLSIEEARERIRVRKQTRPGRRCRIAGGRIAKPPVILHKKHPLNSSDIFSLLWDLDKKADSFAVHRGADLRKANKQGEDLRRPLTIDIVNFWEHNLTLPADLCALKTT